MPFRRVIYQLWFPAAYIVACIVWTATGHGLLWFVISVALAAVGVVVWVVIDRRRKER